MTPPLYDPLNNASQEIWCYLENKKPKFKFRFTDLRKDMPHLTGGSISGFLTHLKNGGFIREVEKVGRSTWYETTNHLKASSRPDFRNKKIVPATGAKKGCKRDRGSGILPPHVLKNVPIDKNGVLEIKNAIESRLEDLAKSHELYLRIMEIQEGYVSDIRTLIKELEESTFDVDLSKLEYKDLHEQLILRRDAYQRRIKKEAKSKKSVAA